MDEVEDEVVRLRAVAEARQRGIEATSTMLRVLANGIGRLIDEMPAATQQRPDIRNLQRMADAVIHQSGRNLYESLIGSAVQAGDAELAADMRGDFIALEEYGRTGKLPERR